MTLLCSTKCPDDKVLEFYEWARQQCDEGGTVISGFHSSVEKDVLDILARRGANIIWVPARDLPKRTPRLLQDAEAEDRLLISLHSARVNPAARPKNPVTPVTSSSSPARPRWSPSPTPKAALRRFWSTD